LYVKERFETLSKVVVEDKTNLVWVCEFCDFPNQLLANFIKKDELE
jgi:rubrerythrin